MFFAVLFFFFLILRPPPEIYTLPYTTLFRSDLFGGVDAMEAGEALIADLKSEPGVRLPGDRRAAVRPTTPTDGVEIPASLHETIQGLI